jgi:hypothetical protein
MTTLQIFDPALCCRTGVSGVAADRCIELQFISATRPALSGFFSGNRPVRCRFSI